MASNAPSACCASGFKHEGNPVGELKNIDGGKFSHFRASSPKEAPKANRIAILFQ